MAQSPWSVLTFYGAYHSNPINITIHEVCVPILLWTFQVMASVLPVPAFIPAVHVAINQWFTFDLNVPALHALLYIIYYFALEPTAAALYVPQLALSLLTATAFSYTPDAIKYATALHIGSWIAQFVGHYGPEGRSPALLDNIVGAVVLAPFFVHLEILFALGYKPELHRELKNSIGTEILKIKRAKKASKREDE
ncbi:hypothetical protein IEO21_07243 [Rhodonia placenta]|uniref:DUF962-domain-containing protein n=2 Tax=Rhodonia placenta TaxID=104341 RepID=A0A1X6MT17_9APHY|nr:hypothetical protein POSPLADRAFT_1067138 [Postia placenta MAD-698-R-SB12]KAF9809843.1 hypothetical protein IEO21_07243 [Postia placenta]OSX59313.1 hypothetical protein POSPLADRAFT_1067138 [Postia placenta MAD-698-R-SB12]